MNQDVREYREELAKIMRPMRSYGDVTAALEVEARKGALRLHGGQLEDSGIPLREEKRSPHDLCSMTTIVAFETQDGAIVAADSRATWYGDFKPALGSFVKLAPMLNHASLGFSGSAADGQLLMLLVEEDFEWYKNFHSTPMSARSMANRINIYSSYLWGCSPIFAVWDETKQKARLFAYGGGSMNEITGGYNAEGSGSSAIRTAAERVALTTRTLPTMDALPLVEDVMIQAVESDSFTGGDFLFHLITAAGVEEIRMSEKLWQLKRWYKRSADAMIKGEMSVGEFAMFKSILNSAADVFSEAQKAHPQAPVKKKSKGGTNG